MKRYNERYPGVMEEATDGMYVKYDDVEAMQKVVEAVCRQSTSVGAEVKHYYGTAPIPRMVITLVEKLESIRLLSLSALKEDTQ